MTFEMGVETLVLGSWVISLESVPHCRKTYRNIHMNTCTFGQVVRLQDLQSQGCGLNPQLTADFTMTRINIEPQFLDLCNS